MHITNVHRVFIINFTSLEKRLGLLEIEILLGMERMIGQK
jgi:hypothetical protein